MSSSNCFFLTYIQISQEAGQVVLYSHLFKDVPQFVVIHTVKGSSVINEAEVDVFLELSIFFYDPTDIVNLISSSSAFSNPAWISGSSQFTYCWSLAWRIWGITLLVCVSNTSLWPSLMAQMVKKLPAMQETWVGPMVEKDPMEKEVATHSSILACRSPWTRGVWHATVHGVPRVRYKWATNTSTFILSAL